MGRKDWVSPNNNKMLVGGWRLLLKQEDSCRLASILEERLLHEQANNPNANWYRTEGPILIDEHDAVWLHDALGELLASWTEETKDEVARCRRFVPLYREPEVVDVCDGDGSGWCEDCANWVRWATPAGTDEEVR